MKTLLLFSLATLTTWGQVVKVPPRNIVPMEVQLQAKDAVQKMVDLTLRGGFQEVVDSMNPEFLKIQGRAKRMNLEQMKTAEVQKLNAMGKEITMQAMITLAPKSAFEVDYGFENQVVDGKEVQVALYRSWMVFVPTVADFSVMDRRVEPAVMRFFRKWGFETAICKKGTNNWTFINGDIVSALELRRLFKFLPMEDKDYNFPETRIEEIIKK